jgi:hypothetical protein
VTASAESCTSTNTPPEQGGWSFRQEQGDALELTLRNMRTAVGDRMGRTPMPALLHALLLRELRYKYPSINPWYYDLQPELLRRFHPGVPVAVGPPSSCVIEEPPFITIRPTEPLGPGDLEQKELVIKSPSNAFRLPFFRTIFPRARVRVLHLTREAAPSIAGLINGWLYRGFHSHRLPGVLNMPGYVDEVGEEERQWWKFELPPEWREWTSQPLVDVCAWQWARVHQEILATTDGDASSSIRVRFEDLIPHGGVNERAAIRLGEWLGLAEPVKLVRRLRQLPPIMATGARRDRPSSAFAEHIHRVVAGRGVMRVREELGYGCRAG